MDFFDLLSMIGGLALFLYGMNLMGDGLAKASGGRMESILEKLTGNSVKAVLREFLSSRPAWSTE